MRLEGKVAVITGPGSGIGRATAKLFGKEGAKVVVADNNSKAGRETVEEITKAGGMASFVEVDIGLIDENKLPTTLRSGYLRPQLRCPASLRS